jgi:hypothetical protein
MNIIKTIEEEISDYLSTTVDIAEGVGGYSQYRLVRRITLFKNRIYPGGKTDKQGRYKYWFDIIGPRVNSEVKNLQIDTKNFLVFSTQPQRDFTAVFLANARIKEFLWETGRADELNEVVEQFSGDGNALFKRVKGGYEVSDPSNTYIINQTAKTVDETAVIERHELTQSQLIEKQGVWKNVDEVIEHCHNRTMSATERSADKTTTNPHYEIYERNGEVSEAELFEAQGKKDGDEKKYVLAKIIVAGLKKGAEDHKYILFAEKLTGKMSDVYTEAHRGPYKGKWWREGLYELLFDHEVRANEIGNQIARGLEWASKAVFRSSESIAANNILTDIANGNIIKSADLQQVEVRMQGFDQLIADWNRLMADADRVANSFEIVNGETPAGTPFRLGALLDQNAGKLFVHLRQKLTIPYKNIFKKWILPELLKDLKTKDVIRLTGDAETISQLRKLQAENWFVRNLVKIGPAAAIPEIKEALIEQKIKELGDKEPLLENDKKFWEGVLERLWITITGENMDLTEQMSTLATLLQFETDPFRRAFLLDRVYKVKGIDVPPAPQPTAQPVPAANAQPFPAKQPAPGQGQSL